MTGPHEPNPTRITAPIPTPAQAPLEKLDGLVAATGNPHKLDEIRAVFASLGLAVKGLPDSGVEIPEPEETGDTFEANAVIKAAAYAQALRRPVLADDSGLEVDALRGAPGVRSARYAEDRFAPNAPRAERDRLNNAKLLDALADVPDPDRAARFVCVIALADPEGRPIATARGVFEGRIGIPPRVPSGDQGFGYDPLFLVAPDHERTSAELSPDEKNVRSHRGAALRALVDQLRQRDLI